jgi:hypothetical protein
VVLERPVKERNGGSKGAGWRWGSALLNGHGRVGDSRWRAPRGGKKWGRGVGCQHDGQVVWYGVHQPGASGHGWVAHLGTKERQWG